VETNVSQVLKSILKLAAKYYADETVIRSLQRSVGDTRDEVLTKKVWNAPKKQQL